MLSSKPIGSFLVALLVMCSAIGHLHNPVIASRVPGLAGRSDTRCLAQNKSSTAFQVFSARPTKQKGTTEKRHKRLLISKVFQPVAQVTFLKRYRLMPKSVTDYSSTHI